MKRVPIILFAILILTTALIISCDQSDVRNPSNSDMSTYYLTARKAFMLSTGVTLPELQGVTYSGQYYQEELDFLDDVIRAGGSNDFKIDFNIGATLDVYDKICQAISDVFGSEKTNYPDHVEPYYYDAWENESVELVTLYDMNDKEITIEVQPSLGS